MTKEEINDFFRYKRPETEGRPLSSRQRKVKLAFVRLARMLGQCCRYVGLKKVAWCAAFCSWCFGQAGYAQPRTAWSPALFPAGRLAATPAPGMIFGIYFSTLKRIEHCGLVESVRNDWIIGIEGNTNLAGGREGDSVYRKWRHKRSICVYARW